LRIELQTKLKKEKHNPDSEIAMVGIGEKTAKLQGIEVEVGKYNI